MAEQERDESDFRVWVCSQLENGCKILEIPEKYEREMDLVEIFEALASAQ